MRRKLSNKDYLKFNVNPESAEGDKPSMRLRFSLNSIILK
jgi:hypothetical protein